VFTSINRPDWRAERRTRDSSMRRLNLVAGALCAIVLTTGASLAGKPPARPPMPAGYDDPGPAPQNVVPSVVAKLRQTLKDPYSLRDLRICAPNAGRAYYGLEWKRARWSSMIALNSKNSYGGYTGVSVFSVSFENGVAVDMLEMSGLSLLSAAQNTELIARTQAKAQACPLVPDAEVQRLLAH
jgi:hypothetical protein